MIIINVFSKRPLCLACSVFLLSSIIGLFLTPVLKLIVFGCSLLLAVLISVLCLAFKKIKPYRALCIGLSAFMIALALISSFFYFDITADSFEEYYYEEHDIEAIVVSERYLGANFSGYDIIVVGIDGEDTYHKAVLECTYGSVLRPGFAFRAKAAGYPFEDTMGSYDQKLAMHSDKIFIRYESVDENNVAITDEGVFHPTVFFSGLNQRLSRVFYLNLDEDTAAMSSALLLGNKDQLDNTVCRDFTRAGASHVLALSGMHMSIIMGLFMLLLKKLRVKPEIIAVILIFVSFFYLFLTGVPISAARSVIMLLCVYLSMLSSRKSDPLTSLSLAGAVLMLIFPGAVIDAGFWMSYSATLGLLVYLTAFERYMMELIRPFDRLRFILKPLTRLLSVFMAGLFAIIPLIVVLCVFIRRISLFSIISSVVLAIPASGVILLSVLLLCFSSVPWISDVIGSALRILTEFMTEYCAEISDIENVVFSVNYPFAVIAAVILGLTVIYSLSVKVRNLFVSLIPFAAAIVIFISAIFIYNAADSKNINVSYINTSSNSDMIVMSKGGEAIICDIGNGSGDSYYQAVPYVYDGRATEIKAIILTRYTRAHSGTLYDVFSNEKVRELWIPEPKNQDDYHKMVPIVSLAESFGVDVYMYEDGEGLYVFNYTNIKVFHYYLERSVVPVSVVSVSTRSKRLLYCAPGFNECEEAEEINKLLSKSEYVIFGNCGPKTKTAYSVPESNEADIIVFSDKIRAAYFEANGTDNPMLVYVPDSCRILLQE